MTGVEFIVKALEIVGIPQESFYSMNVMAQSRQVTLQGDYKGQYVSKLIRDGFTPKVDGYGHTIIEIPGNHQNPNIRVAFT